MRGEKGLVMAMAGLLMIPLIVFTAFATDLGAWYAQGAEMQRTADAAALAGVVWAADGTNPNKYDTVARTVATRNGYTNNANGVTVDVVRLSSNRVKVTISGPGSIFFSGQVMKSQRLTRTATARYNIPVPMGSPRNFIGTGQMASGSGTSAAENIEASINGYCTAKNQGDQKAARRVANSSGSCSDSTANADYTDENYAYYIELPASRTYSTPIVIFDGNYTTGSGAMTGWADDFNPGGHTQADMTTTFTLYQSDGTPLDDTDNPAMSTVTGGNACSGGGAGTNGTKVFNPAIREDNYAMTGITSFTDQPAWWRICTIPAGAPGGRYILRVTNMDTGNAATLQRKGSNNYAIMAVPGTNQLCDARFTVTCPRVYAKDFLSLRAAATPASFTADFFLAEIGPEHAGKTVTINLWDPAEGGQSLGLQFPNGANTWGTQSFSWSSTLGTCSGSAGALVTSINISGCNFNGQTLTLRFALPVNYNPPATNKWYRIAYQFTGTGATDRTTWSIDISGDPVALVE